MELRNCTKYYAFSSWFSVGQRTFSFHGDIFFTGLRPATMSTLNELVGTILGGLNSTGHSRRLHASGHVDCVPKDLKTRLLTPEYPGSDTTTVHTDPNCQAGRILSAKLGHKFSLDQAIHSIKAILGKSSHIEGMQSLGFGETGDSDVAVTDGFNLKNATFLCDDIETAATQRS